MTRPLLAALALALAPGASAASTRAPVPLAVALAIESALRPPQAAAPPAAGPGAARAPLPAQDPLLEAFALRLHSIGSSSHAAPQAAAAAPEAARAALSVARELLQGFDPDEVRHLPPEQIGVLAGRVWERMQARVQQEAVLSAAAPGGAPEALAAGAAGPRFAKLYLTLENYLAEHGFGLALRAMHFAGRRHTGLRKDGVTPEFQHPIEVALYVRTLKGVPNEELALAAALLHDVIEDHGVAREELEALFGADLARIVSLLSKEEGGVKKDADAYFDGIARDPVASLVKGADRIQNVQSMLGVFPPAKQKEYIREVEERLLPMIKTAKALFPAQAPAYVNIRQLLKSQLHFLKAIHQGRP